MKEQQQQFLFPDKRTGHISLLKYTKSSCGVDFMLNTADSSEKRPWFDVSNKYKTDFFEFHFFRKGAGFMLLNGERVDIHDNMVLIISPYQQQEWHVDIDALDYTFLVFQEDFLYNFLSDKYFMYRLLYCYQHDNPQWFDLPLQEMEPFISILRRMKMELRDPIADSYHLIVAYLCEFLLNLNRLYAKLFNLKMRLPANNYAFHFKELLEKNIREYIMVSDYAMMLGISRITLNKSVMNEFGVSPMHLIKQRLLQEVKTELLFSGKPMKEIAKLLHFSAPSHLMRFFKSMTGTTIGEFMKDVERNGLS